MLVQILFTLLDIFSKCKQLKKGQVVVVYQYVVGYE